MTEQPCNTCGRPVDGAKCEMGHAQDSAACFICRREAFHFLKYKGQSVCGTCAPFSSLGEKVITDCEVDALEHGGMAGGEYLDSIGKTDLAELTEEQWGEFLGKVLEGYSDHMRGKVTEDPPF